MGRSKHKKKNKAHHDSDSEEEEEAGEAPSPNTEAATEESSKEGAKKTVGGGNDGKDAKPAVAGESGAVKVVRIRDPIDISYCPVCTFPAEFCEYSGKFEECKPWLLEQKLDNLDLDGEEKGRKRKVAAEAGEVVKKKAEKVVLISLKEHKKRKYITSIQGLDLFLPSGTTLKHVAKDFKKLFSCSCGIEEAQGVLPVVEVQGDVMDQLTEILPEKYGVPPGVMFEVGKAGKRTPLA